MRSRIPWPEKLKKPAEPQIVEASNMTNVPGARSLLIPTPMLVLQEVQKIPPGRVLTMGELRRRLASQCGADAACPLTTGIFLSIVAHATVDAEAKGEGLQAPYWRVVKENGSLNPRFPGGWQDQQERLQKEGVPFRTVRAARPPRVLLSAAQA